MKETDISTTLKKVVEFQIELNKLSQQFIATNKVGEELRTLLDNEGTDINDFIQDRYPFNFSFDELWFEVKKWVESTNEKLSNY